MDGDKKSEHYYSLKISSISRDRVWRVFSSFHRLIEIFRIKRQMLNKKATKIILPLFAP